MRERTPYQKDKNTLLAYLFYLVFLILTILYIYCIIPILNIGSINAYSMPFAMSKTLNLSLYS